MTLSDIANSNKFLVEPLSNPGKNLPCYSFFNVLRVILVRTGTDHKDSGSEAAKNTGNP